jgi:hypothetical protein
MRTRSDRLEHPALVQRAHERDRIVVETADDKDDIDNARRGVPEKASDDPKNQRNDAPFLAARLLELDTPLRLHKRV